MKKRTFPVYSDLSHAWVKVPKDFLRQIIGKDWRKVFTCFSYETHNNVYLEENEDAARFVNWCRASSIEPILKDIPRNSDRASRIRNYPYLQPIGE
jgi:hypothetical protein